MTNILLKTDEEKKHVTQREGLAPSAFSILFYSFLSCSVLNIYCKSCFFLKLESVSRPITFWPTLQSMIVCLKVVPKHKYITNKEKNPLYGCLFFAI